MALKKDKGRGARHEPVVELRDSPHAVRWTRRGFLGRAGELAASATIWTVVRPRAAFCHPQEV